MSYEALNPEISSQQPECRVGIYSPPKKAAYKMPPYEGPFYWLLGSGYYSG
jgi:hypothetical protein